MSALGLLSTVQWTARVSLVVFSVAFALEQSSLSRRTQRGIYGMFVLAHTVHFAAVAGHFAMLRQTPPFTLKLGMLALGVVAVGIVAKGTLSPGGMRQWRAVPPWASGYIWLLFAGTHATRLFAPDRSPVLHGSLLAIALTAAASRALLNRKRSSASG